MATDPRNSRAWRVLRDKVVAEEPDCRLRLPGVCTSRSTTADHIQTYRDRPDLAMVRANLRGACDPCNRTRGSMPDDLLPSAQAARPRALDIFKASE